jgi:hypothetical protein
MYISRVKLIQSWSTNPISKDPFYHAWVFHVVFARQVSPSNSVLAIVFFSKRAERLAHLMPTDFIILKMCGDGCISQNTLLCSLLQHPVASLLFNPNRFLNVKFSENLSRWSSSSTRDQISNPHKTRDNIIVLQYILLLVNTALNYVSPTSQLDVLTECHIRLH